MSQRDYYEVLGVPRTANADEIRRAHRKLARQFHPDVNKSPDAARKFAELQQAYEVLSDSGKRAAYDKFGHNQPGAASQSAGQSGPFRWSTSGGSGGFDFEAEDLGSVFDAFFGSRYGQSQPSQQAGQRAQRPRRAQRQQTVQILVPFLVAARGGTHSTHISIDGVQKTVEVAIPPGTAEGTKLRVKPPGSETHIVFVVAIEPHPVLTRLDSGRGNLDLALDVPLTIPEAVLGATVRVPTLDGSADLAIPPGSSSGRKLRLRGLGIRLSDGTAGDLYATVRIIAPEPSRITPELRSELEALASRLRSPRDGPGWPK
ncbi:MAG: DnaJ domain-containing protein [Phycisphaeraceae bacterium]|nr:DnaJ domain-containing protein [Phycisphaeraceae bacterium]MBX3367782.1 DnaJ domain-containing protein [Phycisphaeraceae bacterium]